MRAVRKIHTSIPAPVRDGDEQFALPARDAGRRPRSRFRGGLHGDGDKFPLALIVNAVSPEGDAGKHPGRPDDGQAYQRVPGPKPDQDTQRGGEDHPRHTGTSFPPGPSAAGGYVDGTTRPCRSGRRADGYG